MKEIKVKIKLTEEMLGTTSSDPKIHEEYIASKAPDALKREEEVERLGVEAVVEKAKTIFPKLDDGTPHLWDYQIKGMFKDACGMLRRVPGNPCSKIKAFKKEIDGLLFINERKIPIHVNGAIGSCQRPLRSDGATGSIVALANSETVPAGSEMEFTIILMADALEDMVRACLDYGKYRGIGQWRNSGKGTFEWQEV